MNASYQASLVNRHIRRFTGRYSPRSESKVIILLCNRIGIVTHVRSKVKNAGQQVLCVPVALAHKLRFCTAVLAQVSRWDMVGTYLGS